MSNAYYTGGERDPETGEYEIPSVWTEESNALFKKKADELKADYKEEFIDSVEEPIEFTNGYYINGKNRRDAFHKSSDEYWEWELYRQYAMAVKELYNNCLIAFYTKYKSDSISIQKNKESKDLNELADDLNKKERELTSKFYSSSRTIKAKISNNAPLKRLQMFGAKAWIMYHMLNNEQDKQNMLPIKQQIDFKNNLETADLDKSEVVIKIFRDCTLLKNRLNKVGSSYLIRKHGGSYNRNLSGNKENLYEDVDSLEVYDEIAKTVGANSHMDYYNILKRIKPKVEYLSQNPLYNSLIKFYDFIEDMNILSWYVKNITEGLIVGNYFGLYPYIIQYKENSIDCYKSTTDYLKACKRLKENLLSQETLQDNSIYLKDLDKMIVKLASVINYAKPFYNNPLNETP